MSYYLVELSKYGINILMLMYTLESFLLLKRKDSYKKTGVYVLQGAELFLIQFLSFLMMFLVKQEIEYLFFYAFLQIALFSTMVLYRMLYPKIDRLLLNNMCTLLSIGFIMLTRLDYAKSIKQFLIVVMGLILSLFIPFLLIKGKFLKHLSLVYGLLGISALGVVLLLGRVTQGSKITYTIAGITIQPSEFVKLIFVFFVASLLCRAKHLWQIILSTILAGVHILILVASKDLGSSLIFFMGYLFVLLIATGNYLYFSIGLLAGSVASVIAYYLFGHVRVRVQAFLSPFAVIDNEGYQMSQSLFALGNGKWFGAGLYQGNPSDIPYVESDFIFSAIAEEFGGIFAICLILICLNCFLIFLGISIQLKDHFYRLLGAGFAVMYIFQIFLTIGGGINFIPLTGVTLPLVSYGGSSVLATIIMFSLMQGLGLMKYQQNLDIENDEEENEEEENEEEDE